MENSISVKEIGAIKDEFYLTENNGYTLSFKVTDFEGKEVNPDDLGLKCTSVMYLDEGEINSQDVPSKDGKLQLNVKADTLKDQNETELRLFFYDKADNKPSLIKNFKIKPNYSNNSVIVWDYAIEMNKVEDFSEEFYNTIKGAKGDKGDKGDKGEQGKSAYEIAVDNGFKGSETEWITKLNESFKPKEAVATFNDLPKIAETKEIRGVLDENAVYVFDGTKWIKQSNLNFDGLDDVKAEIDKAKNKLYTKSAESTRPMVAFYLDDGYQNDYDVVYPKAKSLGIPVTICLFNTSELAKTPEHLKELVANGWELHSHTASHADLNTLTLDQQRKEMADSIKFYKDNFDYELKGICYPKGYTNADTLKAAREYFDVGMSSIPGINDSPNDTYFMYRDLTDAVDLNVIKRKVDKIKADGKGFLVIYSHSNIFKTRPEIRDRYFEMMDYVKESGVETTTISKVMEVYKNTLDIGDIRYSPNYLKVGADGNIVSNLIPFKNETGIVKVNDRPADEYEKGKITINAFRLGIPSDIPFDSGLGTLYTDRMFESSAAPRATQKFEGFDGTIVTRKYLSGAWTEWQKAGDLNLLNNQYKNDTPISSYPVKKVTKTTHISIDNTSFPDNAIGTLETNRLSTNDILNYQMFYPYNKNVFFKRFWTASGWGEWQKFSPTLSGKTTYDFGTLNAGSTSTTTITIAGVVFDDVPSVNVQYGIANGIIVSCYVSAVNTVTVKLFNPTANNIVVGARTFNVAVLKY